MGIRGMVGIYSGKKLKAAYNHYDSNPGGLGAELVEFIQKTELKEIKRIFDNIIVVKPNSKPTPEQIAECREFTDLNVSTGSVNEWYCLLRKKQGGDLSLYAKNPYMIDGSSFIKDSLFCEWAYVINLNDNTLEVYVGFQSKPPKHSRFQFTDTELAKYMKEREKFKSELYYPCELIEVFPLDNIPEGWELAVQQKEEELSFARTYEDYFNVVPDSVVKIEGEEDTFECFEVDGVKCVDTGTYSLLRYITKQEGNDAFSRERHDFCNEKIYSLRDGQDRTAPTLKFMESIIKRAFPAEWKAAGNKLPKNFFIRDENLFIKGIK